MYCASHAARLPTEDELRAMGPTVALAPLEWTQATPPPGSEHWRPFRCAHGP
jgi:hypothetical protein